MHPYNVPSQFTKARIKEKMFEGFLLSVGAEDTIVVL
jgi:hypothetical protein